MSKDVKRNKFGLVIGVTGGSKGEKTRFSLFIGGLIVLAIILGFTIVPSVVIGASPLLLLFVLCPLMMMFMMSGMHKGEGMDHSDQPPLHNDHNPYGILPSKTGLIREEQLAELKSQSSDLQTQQVALTHQIKQMEDSPVVREAEAVVRTAHKHSKH